MKVILDTDPGIDDALAIAYAAAAPEIDLVGLTTIYGNTSIHQASRNARYLVDLLQLDIPVARGAEAPLGASDFQPAGIAHGSEGFGDVIEIPDLGVDHPQSAAEFLVQMAREHGDDLTICTLGPLTNIANALALDPEFAQMPGRVIVLGGALGETNDASDTAEDNMARDPLAADAVFASGLPITLVGLDVTLKPLYGIADFAVLSAASPRVGGFLNRAVQSHLNFFCVTLGIDGCGLQDPTAVVACSHPQLFETVETGLRALTEGARSGATVPDPDRPPVTVCRDMETQAVMQVLTSRIASLH
ncbi:nucleoside hydrolase [Ruegeria sp. 2205SS24-7]|uniref:nucleoside hydrolase n=1 Tax=Ruegeria discodermiae TaxID=3064389 RepID=UPI0027419611|nr:nucleoside hydrolase [Ruegeria sp. 2205SS24-7]MDP5216544.1 nucleoside hydrolase [Ruegeria sp. 2205SS24-7]